MAIDMNIFVPANAQGEFWTEERCYITELHNCDASPESSLAVARVEPGVMTQLHSLTGVIERYIVRRGEGILEIDGAQQKLQVGDQAVIPAGAAQRIENTGSVDLGVLLPVYAALLPAVLCKSREIGRAGFHIVRSQIVSMANCMVSRGRTKGRRMTSLKFSWAE